MLNVNEYDQLNELLHAAEAADSCFRIWKFLDLLEDAPERVLVKKVLDQYPQFFWPTRHAHLVGFVMALSRLYDRGRDAISLNRCRHLRKKLGPSELTSFEGKLSTAKPMIEKTRKLRNNLFAHQLDTDAQKLFADIKLKVDEIRELIDLSRQSVDLLCSAWSFPKWDPMFAAPDTMKLLMRLGA